MIVRVERIGSHLPAFKDEVWVMFACMIAIALAEGVSWLLRGGWTRMDGTENGSESV